MNPPVPVTRDTYRPWLDSIQSEISAFYELVFNWYEQLPVQLPQGVATDPDRLFVAVDRVLKETITLENSGEIGAGNTVGFEAYGLVGVPIARALEATLFYSGKPIGKREGDTYPFDSVFGRAHCSIQEKWGDANYFSRQSRTGGGIVQDLFDDYTVLVRSNSFAGFTVFTCFFAAIPGKTTPDQAHLSIVDLRPRTGDATEIRQIMCRNGQSYAMFGVENGRRQFGFNVPRIRTAQKAFMSGMFELHTTGTIKENTPRG
jgi:hypothetical protein